MISGLPYTLLHFALKMEEYAIIPNLRNIQYDDFEEIKYYSKNFNKKLIGFSPFFSWQ